MAVHDVTFDSVKKIAVRDGGSDELDLTRIPIAIELGDRKRREPRATCKVGQQARFLRFGAGVQYGIGREYRRREIGRAK